MKKALCFKGAVMTIVVSVLLMGQHYPPHGARAQEPNQLQLVAETPIFGLGESGAWDDGLVAVGTVVVDDGLFHLYYNGGTADDPVATSIGHATSADGIDWTRDPANPILTPEMVGGSRTPSNVTALSVAKDGATWVMYTFAYLLPGNVAGIQMRRATAPSLDGPWTLEADPIVFGPGDGRQWDSNIDSIDVSATDHGFVMYYDGCCNQGHNFGRAASPDGIHWTKYDDPATTERAFEASDPVYFSTARAWNHYIAAVNVIQTDTGWAMIYHGVPRDSSQFGIGFATSSDGITWTDFAGNPLFVGAYLGGSVFDRLRASVIVDSTLMVFFDPSWDNDVTGIYLATWTLPTEQSALP